MAQPRVSRQATLSALSAYALRAKPTYDDASAPDKEPMMDATVGRLSVARPRVSRQATLLALSAYALRAKPTYSFSPAIKR